MYFTKYLTLIIYVCKNWLLLLTEKGGFGIILGGKNLNLYKFQEKKWQI